MDTSPETSPTVTEKLLKRTNWLLLYIALVASVAALLQALQAQNVL